jgi:bifunctional DNase/RNase
MAVRMELSRILIRELNDYQIIELREVMPGDEADGDIPDDAPKEPGLGEPKRRSFPIVIGLPEAQAIDRRLKGITIKRPQTHDLLANVIQRLGGTLVSITINDLTEHTFFATLDVKAVSGELLHIDSRPSDAIALGVAQSVPIFVEEHVLQGALEAEP